MGRLPMRTVSLQAFSPRYHAAAHLYCQRMPHGDSDRKTMDADTECGKVSLAILKNVQALPHLAFLPSMEPPLVFWYDTPQWMRPVE